MQKIFIILFLSTSIVYATSKHADSLWNQFKNEVTSAIPAFGVPDSIITSFFSGTPVEPQCFDTSMTHSNYKCFRYMYLIQNNVLLRLIKLENNEIYGGIELFTDSSFVNVADSNLTKNGFSVNNGNLGFIARFSTVLVSSSRCKVERSGLGCAYDMFSSPII
jgi:hypothetical protein